MAAAQSNKFLRGILRLYGLEPHEVLSQAITASVRTVHRSTMESMMELWTTAISSSLSQQRRTRYADYDAMDAYSDISVALDVYAEEATQKDHDEERTVWVTGDSEIVDALHALFDRIDLEDHIFGMARHIAKYGDMFGYIMTQGSEGIARLVFPHPSAVERLDDQQTQRLRGFKYSEVQSLQTVDGESNEFSGISDRTGIGDAVAPLDAWEIVHWAIPGSNLRTKYGYSMIEPARRTWRELEMLETAMAIYRLHRAGLRLVYYVDVGTAAPDEAEEIIQEYKRRLKDRTYLKVKDQAEAAGRDANFADYLSKYNPLNLLDDIFWPIRDGSSSKVDVLQSQADVRQISDVDYFKTKLRTALNIPKAFFDGDISGWGANKALAQQDIRFAKKIIRLQRALCRGLERLCAIHLTLMGLDGENADFTVHMAASSSLFDEQRLAAVAAKLNQAISMMGAAATFGLDRRMWATYVMEKYLDFSPSFIKKYQTDEEPEPIQTAPGMKPNTGKPAGAKDASDRDDPTAGGAGKDRKESRSHLPEEILAALRERLRASEKKILQDRTLVEGGFIATQAADPSHGFSAIG